MVAVVRRAPRARRHPASFQKSSGRAIRRIGLMGQGVQVFDPFLGALGGSSLYWAKQMKESLRTPRTQSVPRKKD